MGASMSTSTSVAVERVEQLHPAQERLYSLDLFRGLTIAAMIVVNNQSGPSAYPWLQHARWNGCTLADLVFPFFLFIVGVSLVFSFNARLRRGDSRQALILHTLRRSAVLFFIGLALNGLAARHLDTWRIPGVLQRIALVYLAAALITLFTTTRTQAAWLLALLAGYWVLMRYVPVPGYGVPGHDIPLLQPKANLAAYLDRKFMLGHLWERTRDPEGILSTLPAIATALCGVLAGHLLRSERLRKEKAALLLGYGLLSASVGVLWNIWFPINKNLWTSSYVLFTAGCALIALASCYWVADIHLLRGAWTKPFIILGSNAIAAYVISELIGGWYAWRGYSFFRSVAQSYSVGLASLLHSLLVLLVCFVPIGWMYRRKIFLKV
ncbi:MAG TPA: heparan-alpha-glucosaminide N-acetyltransferase domain-containing protein [Burkholderiales bacterium]|nr:heparan-alpha-glucosaminide N-acetyltransferase domain-containing protein [Burkholderiales bacterium]